MTSQQDEQWRTYPVNTTDYMGLCGTCRHWLDMMESEAGQCHRYAPKPQHVSFPAVDMVVVWPETEAGEWCGEWEHGSCNNVVTA